MTAPRSHSSRVDALQPDRLADETVRFSLDGVDLEISLCAMNAHRLREILGAVIPFARRQLPGDREPARSADLHRRATHKVRAWAVAEGLVGERGRIPDEVWRAYVHHHRRLQTAAVT